MTIGRKESGALCIAITLLICMAAGGAAGQSINLPATGQKFCYDASGTQIACKATGQDGEFQAGVVWPSPRFTLIGNGCAVTDNLTRLMWAQNSALVEANDWVSVMVTAGNEIYCGYTDWRAANANELGSLMHAGTANLYSWLGRQGFKMQPNYYFSSTFYQNDDSNFPRAWGFYPLDGSLMSGSGSSSTLLATASYSPWIVRLTAGTGTAPARVAQTGQNTCYDSSYATGPCPGTGQDGEYRAGAYWLSPRFIDNGDSTVTDTLTGLMWTTDAMTAGPDPATTPSPDFCTVATKKTWEEALRFVRVCLNSADSPYLGYRDWRLPNKNELASLVDRSRNMPSLAIGNPFNNVIDVMSTYPESGGHWTSTTSLRTRTAAWITEMTLGDEIPYPNSGALHVWPVRENFPLLLAEVNNGGGPGSGTVVKSPAGVDCTTYCTDPCPADLWPTGSSRYNLNKRVTLAAKPDKNSIFSGWSTDPPDLCPGKGNCAVTLSSDIIVTANFTSNPTLQLAPSSKNYGVAKTGRTAIASFTVVNRTTLGKQNLTIDSISLEGVDAGEFVIDPSKDKCSGKTLLPGKSCTFRVLFQPEVAGIKNARVTVLSADDPTGTTNTSHLSATAK